MKARKREFIEAIEDGVVTALQTPKDDQIVRLIEHAPESFATPSWAGERFTHIEITLFAGRSIEVMRKLYRTLVEHVARFEAPADNVKIILIEVDRANAGMRGGRAARDLELGYEQLFCRFWPTPQHDREAARRVAPFKTRPIKSWGFYATFSPGPSDPSGMATGKSFWQRSTANPDAVLGQCP